MILTKATGLIMGPISALMGWLFSLIYNLFYGLNIYSIGFSIIVFTVIIRLAIFPLSVKMTRNSKIQQYLQPEFNKITKKYKGKKWLLPFAWIYRIFYVAIHKKVSISAESKLVFGSRETIEKHRSLLEQWGL